MPSQRNLEICELAKRAAKKSTEPGQAPNRQSRQAKATILHEMRERIKVNRALPISRLGNLPQVIVDGSLTGSCPGEIPSSFSIKSKSPGV